MSISIPAVSDSGIAVPNAGELAELGHAVADMKRQVAALEARVQAACPSLGTAPLLDEIKAMTTGMYPSPSVIRKDFDSDYPDESWFVVEVQDRGEFREMLDRELLWHDKLRAMIGDDTSSFRLCVFPQ